MRKIILILGVSLFSLYAKPDLELVKKKFSGYILHNIMDLQGTILYLNGDGSGTGYRHYKDFRDNYPIKFKYKFVLEKSSNDTSWGVLKFSNYNKEENVWLLDQIGIMLGHKVGARIKLTIQGGHYYLSKRKFARKIAPLKAKEKLNKAPRYVTTHYVKMRKKPKRRSRVVRGVGTKIILIFIKKTNKTETIKGVKGTWWKMQDMIGNKGYVFDAYLRPLK